MCLVFLWNTWFFDNMMAELLSKNIVVGSCCSYNKSFNILLIQNTWQATLVVVTYSISVEEKVTMGYFLDAHDTIPDPKWNVYSEVIFLSSMLPPQSPSVYPISLKSFEVEYIMPKSFVPFTNLGKKISAFQWDSFGVSMNFEIMLTPYIISGLVVVRYIRLPTILLNSVGSTLDPSSSLLNFNHVMTGVGDALEFFMLNLFIISCAYLDCEINISVLDWWTSIPRKYLISPNLVISNSFFMTDLNSSKPKSPVKIKSSTYKKTIKIKSSTYKKTINRLPCWFYLMYSVGSHSLLWNPFWMR